MTLGLQKTKEPAAKTERARSKLVQRLLEGDPNLHNKLGKQPCAVIVINTAELREESADSDLLFSYPPQSVLVAGRGAFTTLSHLLPGIVGSDCKR